MYRVKVTTQHEEVTLSRYQTWCAQNVDTYGKNWRVLFQGPWQTTETFEFINKEDAVLFKFTFAEYLIDG